PDDERPPRPAPSAGPAAATGRGPAGPDATAPSPAPSRSPGPATEGGPAAGGLPDRDGITALWNDQILPSLGGLAKAMYSVGRFVDVQGSTATLAFPNEVHRQKCEQKRSEVESALSSRLGQVVRLSLVVDAAGGSDDRGGPSTTTPAAPEPENLADLGVTDINDLDDAPDAASGGLDALADAFPGSEFIEGP
ncbi:MAG: dnaX, partial [Acidimicrobiales bacterium]|nr:dnaX [Acidimicrobiales bacterium]